MLKSNKNPGPLLNGSRTPTGGPRGTRFPLDIPSLQAPSGSIKCLSGMACRPSFWQAVFYFPKTSLFIAQMFAGAPRRLSPCRFRPVGKGLERETLLPFPRLRRFGTHCETGSKFLLLFSIKSKGERLCFAEKVPNGRTSNVVKETSLTRPRPTSRYSTKKDPFRVFFHQPYFTVRFT